MKINEIGVKYAWQLLKEGKVDTTSPWSITPEEENKILGDGDWEEYAKWFLAIDEEANEETKARYKFPFGKAGKLYRSALIAIRQRAGQFNYKDVFDEAGKLLEEIDTKFEDAREEKWFPIFWNGKHNNKGAKTEWTVDDVERIYEVNKNTRIPIVIKHPEDDLPIIGFARGLRKRIAGGRTILEAKLEKISQWLVDKLKELNLNKISIALDSDLSTIRHLGLTDNPAIEGMPAIMFENEFFINSEDLMNDKILFLEEEVKKAKQEIETLRNEKEELQKKVQALERAKQELAFEAKVKEMLQGVAPRYRDRFERIVQAILKKIDGVEFEKDEALQEIFKFFTEFPKITFERNLVQGSDEKNDINKIVELYNKEVSKWKQ